MGTTTSMPGAKTVIVGANGVVGMETLESLLLRAQGGVDVHCGVRDVKKFKKSMIDVPTVPMDMANKRQMTAALEGFERAFIIVPSCKERTKLAINALEAAKAANVSYILLLSVTIANTDTEFGRQFLPIESKVKSIGIPYTIIRLPMFLDNIFVHGKTAAKDSLINDPRDPKDQHPYITVADVGKCAAAILQNPHRGHIDKTYNLIAGTYSIADLSETMSKTLGKKIKTKQTSWDQFRRVYRDAKVPDWQINGAIEWLKNDLTMRISGDDRQTIRKITGDHPVSMEYFVALHAAKFGWTSPRIAGGDQDYRDDPIMQSRLQHAKLDRTCQDYEDDPVMQNRLVYAS
jgi:uncharacterized protein YbjT (DUF2867 family)